MRTPSPTSPTTSTSSPRESTVKRPEHYKITHGVEAMDVIEAVLDHLKLTPHQSYLMGNILKYRLRAGNKGDAQQDLDKANECKRRLDALRKPSVLDYSCAQDAYASLYTQRVSLFDFNPIA